MIERCHVFLAAVLLRATNSGSASSRKVRDLGGGSDKVEIFFKAYNGEKTCTQNR